MDNSVLTEETAGKISKVMVSADRYYQPGCSWHTWGDLRPKGGPPQGAWVVKMCLGGQSDLGWFMCP